LSTKIIDTLGNTELLNLHKTAFLCSREIPASTVLKCHDWAIQQREQGRCVISGFHSQSERDVFHYLLTGKQPIIMALARGMITRIEPVLQSAVAAGRLLIVTIFERSVKRADEQTAAARNRFMLAQADEIVVGYARPGGMLEKILKNISDKKILRLDR
jgi:hypothetical protein